MIYLYIHKALHQLHIKGGYLSPDLSGEDVPRAVVKLTFAYFSPGTILFVVFHNDFFALALQLWLKNKFNSLLPGHKLEWPIFTTAHPVPGHERVKLHHG